MNTDPVTRQTFIQSIMQSGLTYDQAVRAYNSVMSTIADGVVNGQKVYLGQVGVLNPSVLPPRQIKMGVARKPGGKYVKQTREFFLDARLKYFFRLFRKFSETHELKWLGCGSS
jgi:hypothetical protein